MAIAHVMSNQQSLMVALVETSPFIYLFIPQVFIDVYNIQGTVLTARVAKTSKQFSLQEAHRLEGETYKLTLEHRVGHMIQHRD